MGRRGPKRGASCGAVAMWFDAQAELAKLGGGRESDTFPPATMATLATNAPGVAKVAIVAAPLATTATSAAPAQRPAPRVASVATPSASEINPQAETAGGRVATWTGRVVSLDEWRRLTEWERHGPNGRQWCGITSTWTNQKGD